LERALHKRRRFKYALFYESTLAAHRMIETVEVKPVLVACQSIEDQ
jgi:hypothetical protein